MRPWTAADFGVRIPRLVLEWPGFDPHPFGNEALNVLQLFLDREAHDDVDVRQGYGYQPYPFL